MLTMDNYISGFSQQIKRAVSIGESAQLNQPKITIRNVLLSGLGGSGIGGTILSNILKDELKVPISSNKDYYIPGFVDENSLVIITSYSGNTEETVSAMMQAHKKKAKVVCITSGGLIKEYAEMHKIDYIEIDSGMPPRACLALSFVQLVYTMFYMGLIDGKFKHDISSLIDTLEREGESIKGIAKKVATDLQGTIPVIYVDSKMEGVAVRFRQQLNENSKMLCWHNVIPEMNHNEIVGWRRKHKNLSVVFLRNKNDFERNQQRMDFTKEVVSNYIDTVVELFSKGESDIERSFYLIYLCDWISYYLSEINEVDAMEINVINSLKSKLAENPIK